MKQKITGRFGTFNSIAEATRVLAHTRGPDFIKQYPDYNFPYDPAKMDHHNKGCNNSSTHYIYNVILDLIGDVKGSRKPKDGWKRV